jgi:hypothetical protein
VGCAHTAVLVRSRCAFCFAVFEKRTLQIYCFCHTRLPDFLWARGRRVPLPALCTLRLPRCCSLRERLLWLGCLGLRPRLRSSRDCALPLALAPCGCRRNDEPPARPEEVLRSPPLCAPWPRPPSEDPPVERGRGDAVRSRSMVTRERGGSARPCAAATCTCARSVR